MEPGEVLLPFSNNWVNSTAYPFLKITLVSLFCETAGVETVSRMFLSKIRKDSVFY